MATKIQLRRDSAADWSILNVILSEGEVGFETDTNKFKIGNGSSVWSELEYFGGEIDLSGYLTISSASSSYLTQASASSTYLTQVEGSEYLTQSSASSTYLTQASASSTYLTEVSLSTTFLNKEDSSVNTATASASVVRNITLSTSNPTGGNDGDIWMVYS
jgi:hypothetical protein